MLLTVPEERSVLGRQLREIGMSIPDVCERCPHPMDDHRYTATTWRVVRGRDVPGGGEVICPAPGCRCVGAWSLGISA